MHICMKNIPTKFHPGLIWNDGALGFCEDSCPNNMNKNNKMSSDDKISSLSKKEFINLSLLYMCMCSGCCHKLWMMKFAKLLKFW